MPFVQSFNNVTIKSDILIGTHHNSVVQQREDREPGGDSNTSAPPSLPTYDELYTNTNRGDLAASSTNFTPVYDPHQVPPPSYSTCGRVQAVIREETGNENRTGVDICTE